ncbi:MAG TPA: DNA primase [Candidatus Competibacteraceae bacterium]|nr:DNA primase [Candidatus Competibacteraceae bacterium]
MAGRIPQDFLDHLLGRLDIVELIDSRVPLKRAGREFVACCPFHSEKTPSFTVSPSKQFYHCFGCGAHGNAISFLMDYERLAFPEAVEELARLAGLELPHTAAPESDTDPQQELLAVLEQADQFFRRQLREHPERQRAVDYLRGRGVSGDIARTFGIGYAPPGWDNLLRTLTARGFSLKVLLAAGLVIEKPGGGHYDRFRERIMFPIRDRRGRVIAFGGRTLDDATPKYLNSPETPIFHKGRELYGLYEARMAQRQLTRLVVVEGYMDVVALAQHGLPYAVATLGTATTAEHIDKLFRLTRDIVFCFDGDRAGREAAWRALENVLPQIRDGRQAGFLFLPEGEDPDTLVRQEGRAGFERRLGAAQPLSDYLFERLGRQVDMGSLDGRARLVELARPLLAKLPDSVFRDLMVQRLAQLAQTEVTAIARRLGLGAAPTKSGAPQRAAMFTRTPVRLAMALLLNRPELAQQAGDTERLRGIALPGLPLLIELIELLQQHPHMNAAALLERYRDTDTGAALQKLARWQPEVPEELYQAEFLGALQRLEGERQRNNPLVERALRKSRPGELSDEEREALRNLGRSGQTS